MELNITENHSESYDFKYRKTSSYQNKKIIELNNDGGFSLRLKENENFELCFESERFSSTIKQNLIFSPIKFELQKEDNIYLIKNKEFLKTQWEKYKNKVRNNKNTPLLFLYEQLYFKITLGLEYDLLSNGAYIPFFLNPYNTIIDYDLVIKGMSWVHNPLAIPLKIEYQIEKINENNLLLKGNISLDEELLAKVILDKNFQKQAKSYHYTKDFTIASEIISVYNIKSGYIESTILWLKIFSENEKIDEVLQSEVWQKDKELNLTFSNQKVKPIQEKEVYKTYKGQNFNEIQWKEFEEKEYQSYLERTRRGKNTEQVVNKTGFSFVNDDEKQIPSKKDSYFTMNSKQDKVPVYEFPSTMVAPFIFLENGTAVDVLRYEKNGWCEILSKEKKKGFIQSNHIKKND